jgi:hypothetical protein
MPGPLDRIFRNDLTLMLLRRATWSEAWLSLKRAHKDRRARKHLLGLAVAIAIVILVPVFVLAYVGLAFATGAWVGILLLIPVLWWIRRSAKAESVPPRIVPQPEPRLPEPSVKQGAELRPYLAQLCLLYAVMVDRTGSERFLKEKELPEGVEIVSRRAHLDLLKAVGMWERLAARDREAIMEPDGHWEWERINQVAAAIDPLRLLRWILRIDYHLPLIGQQLQGDFTIAHELVLTPRMALEATELAEEDAMRANCEAARAFFFRCLAECIHRGYQEAGNEKTEEWAKEVAESLSGQQHDDLVLGSRLVSEAGREELLWATSLARNRAQFLNWAIALYRLGHAPEFAFPCVVDNEVSALAIADQAE